MASNSCRVCGGNFFPEPLLTYSNMPKAAQHFPQAADLASETGADLEVCQCSDCGLVQLVNEPVFYFREVIRASAVSEVIKETKTKQFAAFIESHSLAGKKILEVGCGHGEFLSLLHTLDVQACGLEFSKAAVAACLERGLTVFPGYPDLNLGVLPAGPFDAFFLLMFLEHMPEPNVALRVIRGNLQDNAVGVVEVPNFDMILRTRLFSEFIPDHLLYFTSDTLKSTLNMNGFDVIAIDELRDDFVISAVVKKRRPLDSSHFHEGQKKIKCDLVAFIDLFPGNKVAIWGAGHQALAIIALTGIADRIRYVIDSAPFKQGRYTPATHLPVVPPDSLRTDPVDAVIVMAASYSDEVAGIIRSRFSRDIPVAILRDFGLEAVLPR